MVDLEKLQRDLEPLSHSTAGIDLVRGCCRSLNGTEARMAVWNKTNAIVRSPIQPDDVQRLGFDKPEDLFILLQGDIVRTESAYFMGEQILGRVKYAVLNSSCDLVPGRSCYSLLLRIAEIRRSDPKAKAKLGELVKFSRNDAMYIPKFRDDAADVVGNEIQFDGVCQIANNDLLLANRVASLSLIGWRIFASFVRLVLARANPREAEIRAAAQA